MDTVVLHAAAHESVDDLVRELREQDHSYHYVIDREGNIYKGVPFSAVAYHCGNSYGPHEAERKISPERDVNGNFVEHPCMHEYTLGVCLMNRNDGSEPYSREQLNACATLMQDLKTPLPKLRYLTSHAAVSPGKFFDPVGLDLEPLAKLAGLSIWTNEPVYA